jgi:hypothetical protein
VHCAAPDVEVSQRRYLILVVLLCSAACSSSEPPPASADATVSDTSSPADGAPEVLVDGDAIASDGDADGETSGFPDSADARPWPSAPCPSNVVGFTAESPPAVLSATGLYADVATKSLAAGVRPFAPTYELWADGATKRRFISLPDGCAIDTSDLDHWVVPVGTKFWKEFSVDGKRIETRLVARTGPARDDFAMIAYAWRDDESEADAVPFGVSNARATTHDIPATGHCKTCHGYLPEHVLGFGTIQLAHGTGLDLATLIAERRLSDPPAAMPTIPGDTTTVAALGYLHANCGNCHHSAGIEFLRPFDLRLSVHDARVEDTGVYRTAVSVPVEKFVSSDVPLRVSPGNPGASCVFVRPGLRGTTRQMPPIASKVTDPAGLATIEAWIRSLPAP